MDSIFDTSLGHMYGPNFLCLYLHVIVFSFLFLRYACSYFIDKDRLSYNGLIPEKPDLYELAYMRGGETEVINLGIFSLIKRGLITLYTSANKKSILVNSKTKANCGNTKNSIEIEIQKSITAEQINLKDIFGSTTLRSDMEKACKDLKTKLESEGMIWTERDIKKFRRIKIIVMLFVLALGTYKFLEALSNGHTNVFFLLLLLVLGCLVLSRFNVQFFTSARGKDYLKKLEFVFKPVEGDKLLGQPSFLMEVTLAVYGLYLIKRSRYYYLIDYIYLHSFISNKIFWEKFSFMRNFGGGGSCSGGGCGGGGGCNGGCSSGSSCGSSCGGGCGGGCGGCS